MYKEQLEKLVINDIVSSYEVFAPIYDEDELHDILLRIKINGVRIEDDKNLYQEMLYILPTMDIDYINDECFYMEE